MFRRRTTKQYRTHCQNRKPAPRRLALEKMAARMLFAADVLATHVGPLVAQAPDAQLLGEAIPDVIAPAPSGTVQGNRTIAAANAIPSARLLTMSLSTPTNGHVYSCGVDVRTLLRQPGNARAAAMAWKFGYTTGTAVRNHVQVQQNGRTTSLGEAMDDTGAEMAEKHGGGLAGFGRACVNYWRGWWSR